MSFDPHKNFAYSTVATAPSPATSGTSLVLAAGDGTLFPAPATDGAFNVTVWPAGAIPTEANAEICRVTARSSDTLTITRAQEATSARAIQPGDQIALTITAKLLTDIESAIGGGGGGGGVGTGEDSLYTVASSGASTTIDIANGAVQDITLTANCTIALTSPAAGDSWSLTLLLRQDATGSRTVTWPGSVTWLGTGQPPILQTAAGSVDSVVLFTVDGGTHWFGVAQTSASGLRSGTSFPGSPSDGDLFYRTDRDILYFYKSSISKWLSVDRKYVPFTGTRILNASGTAGVYGELPVFEDIYVESWQTVVHVGSVNNASNYWTVSLQDEPPGAWSPISTIASFSTNADTPTTNQIHTIAVGAVVATASAPFVFLNMTKTGSPSNNDFASMLVVRSVG